MANKIAKVALASGLGILFGLGGMAQAQTMQAQSGSPRQAGGSDLVQCAETFLHFTTRGLALECMNPQGITEFIFAVVEGQFPGRSEMVAEVVRDANDRGGPNANAQGPVYRPPDAERRGASDLRGSNCARWLTTMPRGRGRGVPLVGNGA